MLELFIQIRCPVGTIDFVGIVKHGVRERHVLIGKGCVETFQVVSYSIVVKMVNHKTLAPRCCTFHFLPCISHRGMLVLVKNNFLCCIIFRHQWTTKRPTRTCRHIGLNAQFRPTSFYIFKHTHPSRRKIRNVIGVVPLYSINRSNLHSTNTYLGKLFEIVIKPH